MKRLLFALLLLISPVALHAQAPQAQPMYYDRLPLAEGKVVYTAVVPVEGVVQTELYTRAQQWAAKTFKNSKAAERMGDKDAGVFIAHGIINQPALGFVAGAKDYDFTISIFTKDGRYKYVIDQISMKGTDPKTVSSAPSPIEDYAGYKKWKSTDKEIADFDARVKSLIASLTAAMEAKGSASTDW